MTDPSTPLFDTQPRAALEVEHLCDFEIHFQPVQTLISPAAGIRLTFVIDHGVARGPLLNGEFLPGGGDWVTLGTDGVGRLDVRSTLRADDGHLIHVTVTGRSVIAGPALERYAAGETVTWSEASSGVRCCSKPTQSNTHG